MEGYYATDILLRIVGEQLLLDFHFSCDCIRSDRCNFTAGWMLDSPERIFVKLPAGIMINRNDSVGRNTWRKLLLHLLRWLWNETNLNFDPTTARQGVENASLYRKEKDTRHGG